jgi:hypothetical protein
MSSGRFPNLQNKFLFNLRRHSTLYNLSFQSYDQNKMSKNVAVLHFDLSVMWTRKVRYSKKSPTSSWYFLSDVSRKGFINILSSVLGFVQFLHQNRSKRYLDLKVKQNTVRSKPTFNAHNAFYSKKVEVFCI